MGDNSRLISGVLVLFFVLFVAICMGSFLQVFAGHCSAHGAVLTCTAPYFLITGGLLSFFFVLSLCSHLQLSLPSSVRLFFSFLNPEQRNRTVEPIFLTNQVFIL